MFNSRIETAHMFSRKHIVHDGYALGGRDNWLVHGEQPVVRFFDVRFSQEPQAVGDGR